MPGYHNRKKKLYKMGGEMDSYRKGGKMPSWLVEMFKKKAKKSMNLGGNLTGKPTIRETDREPIQFDSVDPNREKGEKKNRMGMVVRHDEAGRPYHVKKGLFNETEYMQHSDGSYSPTVKNRTPLGKFFTGSDAKASFDGGGKMYYVTGGELPDPPEDDIPALDPNADFLKNLSVDDEEARKDLLLDARLKGPADGRLAGLTMASETTQRQGGFDPTLFEATRVEDKPKATKEIVKKEEPEDPGTPPPTIPPPPPPPPKDPPARTPPKDPPARTPSEGMMYRNVAEGLGDMRLYRDRGEGQHTAVGMKEYDMQDRIPTGIRTDDGKAHFANRDVYHAMEKEGVDPYSPEASMFMEDLYSSNPELFDIPNETESSLMTRRMILNDKGVTHAGREGKDSGYFFPDQLFGRMHPEERRKQDIANVRAQQAAQKEAEAERKRKAEERRKQDIAKARARFDGGGKLYHF